MSNWSFERICQLKAVADEQQLVAPIATSPYFSLASLSKPMYDNTTILGHSKAGLEAELHFYTENAIHVLCWASLGKGFFTSDVETFGEDKNGDDETIRYINSCYRLLKNPENISRRNRIKGICLQRGLDSTKAIPSLLVEYVLRKSERTHAIIGTLSQTHFDEAVPANKLSPRELKYLEAQS